MVMKTEQKLDDEDGSVLNVPLNMVQCLTSL